MPDLPDSNVMLLFKFGEIQWIEKLLNGELSFSCAGAFIKQAELSGNTVQGDLYEGSFARLRSSNSLVKKLRLKYGSELEEIRDGDFIFFRRKSARFKPIFCLYAYTNADAKKDRRNFQAGIISVSHRFSENMYQGFSPYDARNVLATAHRPAFIMLQVETFKRLIIPSLEKNYCSYIIEHITPWEMIDGEFYIEPTPAYPELFKKSPAYSDQHEMRICILNKHLPTIYSRYNISIPKIPEGDYVLSFNKCEIQFNVQFDAVGNIIGIG